MKTVNSGSMDRLINTMQDLKTRVDDLENIYEKHVDRLGEETLALKNQNEVLRDEIDALRDKIHKYEFSDNMAGLEL